MGTKVISFSLWGKDPKYTQGAIANAKLAREIFPDWVCRFYIGSSTPYSITEQLIANHPRNGMSTMSDWSRFVKYNGDYLGICGGSMRRSSLEIYHVDKPGDWRMMFDRFLPGCDTKVEAFISRDCDSRLTLREATAVNEWLASDKGLHCMRDHPHHSVPIMGGMWGMKQGTVPHFQALLENWPQEDRLQTDQEFLTNSIWPMVRDNVMCHDTGFFPTCFGGVRPFPTVRLESGEFVGATYDADGVIDVGQVAELKRIEG